MKQKIIRTDNQQLILKAIRNRDPVPKTKLLKLIARKRWKGYISPDFIAFTKDIESVFDSLVESGAVIFEKGKPLRINSSLPPPATYKITVMQISSHLSSCNDRLLSPEGVYLMETLPGEDLQALCGRFHRTVPIGCLEDFRITAEICK